MGFKRSWVQIPPARLGERGRWSRTSSPGRRPHFLRGRWHRSCTDLPPPRMESRAAVVAPIPAGRNDFPRILLAKQLTKRTIVRDDAGPSPGLVRMYTGVPKVFVMPTRRHPLRFLLVVLLLPAAGLLISAPQARAQNDIWLPTATTWEDNTSWSLGSAPGPGQVAEFPANGNIFVFYGVSHQVGQMLFPTNAAAYTFGAGGQTVALQINAPLALASIGINNQSGVPQEFGSGLLNLGGSQTWTTTQAGGNTIIDVPVNGAGFSLTKTGAGDLTFTANGTLNVANFNAQGGRTVFDRPAAAFTMAAGNINVGTTGTAATLQLGGDINNQSNAINPANVGITIGATGTLNSAQG